VLLNGCSTDYFCVVPPQHRTDQFVPWCLYAEANRNTFIVYSKTSVNFSSWSVDSMFHACDAATEKFCGQFINLFTVIIVIIHMTIFTVLSSWLRAIASSPSVLDECRLSARWLPTLRPSQTAWASSPSVGCYHPHPHPPSPFYYYSANADTHFTVPQRVQAELT